MISYFNFIVVVRWRVEQTKKRKEKRNRNKEVKLISERNYICVLLTGRGVCSLEQVELLLPNILK